MVKGMFSQTGCRHYGMYQMNFGQGKSEALWANGLLRERSVALPEFGGNLLGNP